MITPDDVADELGRSRPEQDSATYRQWQKWIDTTYGRVEAYRAQHDLDEPEVSQLDYVVLMAVAGRAGQGGQPDGAQSVTRTIDDGTVTRRYTADGPGVVIDLDRWWSLLWPGSQSGAFTIQPYAAPDRSPDPWVLL